jgi:hypothetical protein
MLCSPANHHVVDAGKQIPATLAGAYTDRQRQLVQGEFTLNCLLHPRALTAADFVGLGEHHLPFAI